jgi:hypothetical protein
MLCRTDHCIYHWHISGATADSIMGISNRSRLHVWVYELSHWMWRCYGRGQPCRVSVEEAEQRRRERLTEASKSTPDIEVATRRARHRGGCWGQGCSGRWMKKRCYGLYHGIYHGIQVYIYIYLSFNIPCPVSKAVGQGGILYWYVTHSGASASSLNRSLWPCSSTA